MRALGFRAVGSRSMCFRGKREKEPRARLTVQAGVLIMLLVVLTVTTTMPTIA